jgi:hypothetical protein
MGHANDLLGCEPSDLELAIRCKQTYLVNVQVGTIVVQVGVVVIKRAKTDTMGFSHFLAIVIRLDMINLLAVFALLSQAQHLPRHQIAALLINLRIESHELIARIRSAFCRKSHIVWYAQGNALGLAYRITDVTSLNGIRACASKNCGHFEIRRGLTPEVEATYRT